MTQKDIIRPPLYRFLLVDEIGKVATGLERVIKEADLASHICVCRSFQEATRTMKAAPYHFMALSFLTDFSRTTERFIASVRSRFPSTYIMTLSQHLDAERLRKYAGLGVSAFLPKTVSVRELELAVATLLEEQLYIHELLRSGILEDFSTNPLTKREHLIIELLSTGHTIASIAETLSISTNTVMTHKKNIFRKLDLHSTVELVRYAIRNGIVTT